jgi:hypothetical protein
LDLFLFGLSPKRNKKNILCDLCAFAVNLKRQYVSAAELKHVYPPAMKPGTFWLSTRLPGKENPSIHVL